MKFFLVIFLATLACISEGRLRAREPREFNPASISTNENQESQVDGNSASRKLFSIGLVRYTLPNGNQVMVPPAVARSMDAARKAKDEAEARAAARRKQGSGNLIDDVVVNAADAMRKAAEESDRKAEAEQARRKAAEEARRKVEEALRKAREEAARKAREEALRKQRERTAGIVSQFRQILPTGKRYCEGRNYDEHQCWSKLCCSWDGDQCRSAVGNKMCSYKDHPLRYTLDMRRRLGMSADSTQDCANDVGSISGNVERIESGVGDVKKLTGHVNKISSNINKILKKLKESGVTDLIGKIPKIGMVIKMGMQLAEKVSGVVAKVSKRLEKMLATFHKVVKKFSKVFKKLGKATKTVADGIQMAYEVVKVASECGMHGPREGGPHQFELINKEALNQMPVDEALTATKKSGQMCVLAFMPYKIITQRLADAARDVRKAIAPAERLLHKVYEFVESMQRRIEEILGSDTAKCGAELVDMMGGKAFKLVTCPKDELVNVLVSTLLDPIERELASMVDKMVGGIVLDFGMPDNVQIDFPDPKAMIPKISNFNFIYMSDATKCAYNQVPLTKYNKLEKDLLDVAPLTIKGPGIAQMIKDALTPVPYVPTGYESACESAWNEMKDAPGFDNCKDLAGKLWDGFVDGAEKLVGGRKKAVKWLAKLGGR